MSVAFLFNREQPRLSPALPLTPTTPVARRQWCGVRVACNLKTPACSSSHGISVAFLFNRPERRCRDWARSRRAIFKNASTALRAARKISIERNEFYVRPSSTSPSFLWHIFCPRKSNRAFIEIPFLSINRKP
jgi:hypothetical protein